MQERFPTLSCRRRSEGLPRHPDIIHLLRIVLRVIDMCGQSWHFWVEPNFALLLRLARLFDYLLNEHEPGQGNGVG